MRTLLTKYLSVVLCLFVLSSSLATPSFAKTNGDTEYSEQAAKIIQAQVEHLNQKDYEAYQSLLSKDFGQDFNYYLQSDEENKQYGILTVESVKVKELKPLPLILVSEYMKIDYLNEKYSNIQAFLVGYDYKVKRESKYYFNGVNYRINLVGQEDGNWKLLSESDAPIEYLAERNLGFNSDDEKEAIKIIEKRAQGIIINKEGTILETNQASVEHDHKKDKKGKKEVGVLSHSVSSGPSTIRVLHKGSQHSTVPDLYNKTIAVNFQEYIEGVLPWEWGIDSTWQDESLKAGAVAVKTFGWWYVNHPYSTTTGTDITDEHTSHQTYVNYPYLSSTYWSASGKTKTRTNPAIKAVEGISLATSTGKLLYASYAAGSYGTGNQSSGRMRQNGTKYWADQGKKWLWMAHYYYDNSTSPWDSTLNGVIKPFFYTDYSWSYGDSLSYYSTSSIDGAVHKWYKITGNGSTSTIETSALTIPYPPYTKTSDTYLELYNSNLELITYDDDGGSGTFSKITSYLNSGTSYYIKVRNYSDGSNVYCTISLQ